MAKADDAGKKEESKGQQPKPTQPGAAEGQQQQPGAAQAQAQSNVRVDDSNVTACYSNFCRVSSTPEELILDLGLNPNPYAAGEQVIPVAQRIIMNHFTAKRLLHALSMALQRHEQAFGVLETDIRKRVRTTTT